MGLDCQKWKSGFQSLAQRSYRQHVTGLPNHLQRVDGLGVYNERKRLKSSYRGVWWVQSRKSNGEWREGRWEAWLRVGKERYYGGGFREENEVEAAKAYDDLVKKHVGLTGPLNFPTGD